MLLTADLIASHTDSSRHRSHNTSISSFAPPPHPTSTVIESPDKNQIFVDIVEYINVTSQSYYYRRNHISSQIQQSHSNGYLQSNQAPIVQNSSIHGNVTMKVFLSNITCDPKKNSKRKQLKVKLKNGKKKKKIFGKKFGRNKNKNKNGAGPNTQNGKGDDDIKFDAQPTVEEHCMEYLQSLPPGIRLQFNDDLVIGRENAPPRNTIFGALILDDVSFHKRLLSSQREIDDIIQEKHSILGIKNGTHSSSSNQLSFIENFSRKKILKFFLPNGEEFNIMNYRITSSFRDGGRSRPNSRRNSPRELHGKKKKFNYKHPNISNGSSDENYTDYIRIPYRILPYFNVIQDDHQTVPTIEFYLKIRADYPRQCIGRDIIIEFNVPNCVSTVTLQTKVGNRTQTQMAKVATGRSRGIPSSAAPTVPGVGSVIAGDPGSGLGKKKDRSFLLSDKELALIKQSAECVTVAKNAHNFSTAFNIDLSAKYSMDDDNSESIGIGKKRQLNPERPTRKVVWRLNKFPSGVEQVLRCKFTLNYHHELTERLLKTKDHFDPDVIEESLDEDDIKSFQQNGTNGNGYNNGTPHGSKEKEFDLQQFRKIVSPIAMKFQIDNYNVSGLDIRSLRCIDWTSQRDDGGSNNGLYTTYRPYRWVRRITKSGSYICRL